MYATQFAIPEITYKLLSETWTRKDASAIIDPRLDISTWTYRLRNFRKYGHYFFQKDGEDIIWKPSFEFDFHFPPELIKQETRFEKNKDINYKELTWLYINSFWLSLNKTQKDRLPRFDTFITCLINDEWPRMRMQMEAALVKGSEGKYSTLESWWSFLMADWLDRNGPMRNASVEPQTINL